MLFLYRPARVRVTGVSVLPKAGLVDLGQPVDDVGEEAEQHYFDAGHQRDQQRHQQNPRQHAARVVQAKLHQGRRRRRRHFRREGFDQVFEEGKHGLTVSIIGSISMRNTAACIYAHGWLQLVEASWGSRAGRSFRLAGTLVCRQCINIMVLLTVLICLCLAAARPKPQVTIFNNSGKPALRAG